MNIQIKPQGALCAILTVAAASLPAQAQSSLSFISEPGDEIGQGQSRTLTDVETARRTETEILVEALDGDEWFILVLAAPERLRRGVYENVARADGPRLAGQPGLYFYGNNRGCESIQGRFQVVEIKFGAFGYVERLRANFEQRCNGSTATLWGDVIIDNPPRPRAMKVKLGVEPAAILYTNGAVEARPYYRIVCEYPTFGRIAATLEQPLEGGGMAYGSFNAKTPCGPTPQRVYLPISSDSGIDFRAGPAAFTIEARMEDPNYSEFETDAEVVKTVSRRTRLRTN